MSSLVEKLIKSALKARKSGMEDKLTQCEIFHLIEAKMCSRSRFGVLVALRMWWCHRVHEYLLLDLLVSYVVGCLHFSINHGPPELIPYSVSVLNSFFTFYSRLCGAPQRKKETLLTHLIFTSGGTSQWMPILRKLKHLSYNLTKEERPQDPFPCDVWSKVY